MPARQLIKTAGGIVLLSLATTLCGCHTPGRTSKDLRSVASEEPAADLQPGTHDDELGLPDRQDESIAQRDGAGATPAGLVDPLTRTVPRMPGFDIDLQFAEPLPREQNGRGTPAGTQPAVEDASLAIPPRRFQSTRKVEHVSAASFQEDVLDLDAPVLVDFYADWCGPCRKLAPALEQLARDNPAAKVVKVNIDKDPQLAAAYDVTSIPKLMVFRDGEVVAEHRGMADAATLRRLLAN